MPDTQAQARTEASVDSSLTIDDFASLFGCGREELPGRCHDLIASHDWRYVPIEGEALDDIARELLDRIRQRNFSIVVPEDKSRWIRGWSENLADFLASKGDAESLAPRYIRPNMPIRLFRRFVRPRESRFELNWYRVFQEWLFRKYFRSFDVIYEFGCGSGINVARLAEMFPEKKIVGLDWAEPACEIINSMRQLRGWNTEGRLFDFFNPDEGLTFAPNSIVFTVGALEQTSTRHAAFIDFLLRKKPALCLFIEPIYDWYDPANLADHFAIRIHDTRNFWKGFPEHLATLARQGRVEIIKQKRADFGSLLLEGYSQNIWRPC